MQIILDEKDYTNAVELIGALEILLDILDDPNITLEEIIATLGLAEVDSIMDTISELPKKMQEDIEIVTLIYGTTSGRTK